MSQPMSVGIAHLADQMSLWMENIEHWLQEAYDFLSAMGKTDVLDAILGTPGLFPTNPLGPSISFEVSDMDEQLSVLLSAIKYGHRFYFNSREPKYHGKFANGWIEYMARSVDEDLLQLVT